MLVSFGCVHRFPLFGDLCDPRPLAVLSAVSLSEECSLTPSFSLRKAVSRWPLFPLMRSPRPTYLYTFPASFTSWSSHWKDPSGLHLLGNVHFAFRPRLCRSRKCSAGAWQVTRFTRPYSMAMPPAASCSSSFFGVGEEAVADYKPPLVYIGGLFGWKPSPSAFECLAVWDARYVATVGPYDLCDYG